MSAAAVKVSWLPGGGVGVGVGVGVGGVGARRRGCRSSTSSGTALSFPAIVTRPVAEDTFCLVEVTLLRCSEAASLRNGVPSPAANDGLAIDVDLT